MFEINLPKGLTGQDIHAGLEAIHKKFHGKAVVLFVAHPADYKAITDQFEEYSKSNHVHSLVPRDRLMGVPVWQTPKIKQGEIRSYKTWTAAYNDLKDILNSAADIEHLKMQMLRENGL